MPNQFISFQSICVFILLSGCVGDAHFRFLTTLGLDSDNPVALSIVEPSASSIHITCDNLSQFPLSGTCSHPGRAITLTTNESELALATTSCSSQGTWSFGHFFAQVPAGSGSVLITHADSAGNTITRARTYTKEPSAKGGVISDASDLIQIQNNKSGCYHLLQNIDLHQVNWTHAQDLGSESAPFTGTINGNGFAIENLRSRGSFVGVTRGATFKNLHFTNMTLGEGAATGGDGVVALAYANASQQPTRFLNVHLINAEILGSGIQNRISMAGGLAAKASAVEVRDSTAQITFRTTGYGEFLGGLVGAFHPDQSQATLPSSLLIENSRVRMELEWLPSALNQAPQVTTSILYSGGLIGEVYMPLNRDMSFGVNRTRVSLKAHADGQADEHGFFLIDSGGIVGNWGSRCPNPNEWWISETAIDLDVSIRSGQPLSGIHLFGGMVGRDLRLERCFNARDVSITGRLDVAHGRVLEVGGALGSSNSLSSSSKLHRIFSDLRFDLISTLYASSSRAFYAGSFSGNQISASGLFFNADLISPLMSLEQLALPLSTTQMKTASTWINAGYPTDVWIIQNGATPSLKNITAQFR